MAGTRSEKSSFLWRKAAFVAASRDTPIGEPLYPGMTGLLIKVKVGL
jgi:hypothetical protein